MVQRWHYSKGYSKGLGAAIALCLTSAACDKEGAAPQGKGLNIHDPEHALRPEPARGEVPKDAAIASYAIEAKLDTTAHRIEGRERITWRNTGNAPVSTLAFHLYLNGFRSDDTAWMTEGRGSHRTAFQNRAHPWGYCDVKSVELVATGEALAFAEGDDPSVMHARLPTAIAAGETIEVDVTFSSALPGVFARTGFADEFYMVGQWFPKLGVLRQGLPPGSPAVWDNHVFTFHSEFYADFGDYRVELDIPKHLTVGATGVRVSEQIEGDRKIATYEAKMVHDFAWTASADFVDLRSEYEGIRIRQLIPAAQLDGASKHLRAQHEALKSMQQRFGPYPWSTITIVHPPPGAAGAAGMEYPTLYTTDQGFNLPAVAGMLGFTERVSGVFTTVHEFGHQYFQGLLASNEDQQPWVDEGLNTFSNTLVLEDWFGPDPWLFQVAGERMYLRDVIRLSAGAEGLGIVDQSAQSFSRFDHLYGGTVYRKTATVMRTLRNLAGHAAFDSAIAAYTARYRFAHPTGADFEQVMLEHLGRTLVLAEPTDTLPGSTAVTLDVAAIFDQGLRSADTVDFGIRSLLNLPTVAHAGWSRDAAGELVGGDPPSYTPTAARSDADNEAVIVLERRGGFVLPVEVEIHFADDTSERLWWDGRGHTKVLRFPGRKVVRAGLDPDGNIELESKRLNNHRYASWEPEQPSPANDLAQVSEAIMLSVLGGFGP